jgi:nucleotide-binding universal stress UspA family protein
VVKHHILCGFDGSAGSVEAARWAAAEATRRRAGLTLLACYTEPFVTDFDPSASFLSAVDTIALRDATRAKVDDLATRLSDSWPGLAVDACVAHARAARALIAHAAQADLLVLGATGSGDPHAALVGSVVRSVLRDSPCPVVVVPVAGPPGEVPRVVVGTDGTSRSAAALDWAVDECDLLRGELEVVHAYSYPYEHVEGSSTVARDLLRVDAATQLARGVERARGRGASKVEGHLACGGVARVLLERGEDADLVVIGMRRDASRSRYLAGLGSVIEALVARPPCPAAVVPEAAGGVG